MTLTDYDLDDVATFPSKAEAVAAAILDEKPRARVRPMDGAWVIGDSSRACLVWSELPKSAHARGASAAELAEIWGHSVADFTAFLRGKISAQQLEEIEAEGQRAEDQASYTSGLGV